MSNNNKDQQELTPAEKKGEFSAVNGFEKPLSKCVAVIETQGVEEKLRINDMRGGSCLMSTWAGGIWVCSICVSKKLPAQNQPIPVYFHISLYQPSSDGVSKLKFSLE